MVDSVPVLGHAKGVVHYAVGDTEGGDSAMLASTRSTAVLAGGVGGGILGGLAGAIAGGNNYSPMGQIFLNFHKYIYIYITGISAGAAADGVFTGVDSAVSGSYSPHGHFQMIDQAVNGKMDAGTAFDWVMMPVFDGLAGRAWSKTFETIRARIKANNSLRAAIKEAIDSGQITLQEGETVTSLVEQLKAAAAELQKATGNAKGPLGQKSVATMVIDMEGNKHVGYSFRLRQALNVDAFEGEVPSTRLILDNRLPGRSFSIRGENMGQPACAENHALHQHHKANGLNANPARTITVVADGNGIKAQARCGNCAKVGRYVNMGEVPTDVLNGTTIPTEIQTFDAAVDLLQTLEGHQCDESDQTEHEHNE